MADVLTTLKDENGNNVFPNVKMYLHKIHISGRDTNYDITGNDIGIYFQITNNSPFDYNKDTLKPLLVGNPLNVYAYLYGRDDEDPTALNGLSLVNDQLSLDYISLGTNIQINYNDATTVISDSTTPL